MNMKVTTALMKKTFCLPDRQGSSKLEKAEILQMTVDHLKLLHAMGGKGEISCSITARSYIVNKCKPDLSDIELNL